MCCWWRMVAASCAASSSSPGRMKNTRVLRKYGGCPWARRAIHVLPDQRVAVGERAARPAYFYRWLSVFSRNIVVFAMFKRRDLRPNSPEDKGRSTIGLIFKYSWDRSRTVSSRPAHRYAGRMNPCELECALILDRGAETEALVVEQGMR